MRQAALTYLLQLVVTLDAYKLYNVIIILWTFHVILHSFMYNLISKRLREYCSSRKRLSLKLPISLLITTKMYIEYSAVIFSTKFKSKCVTYQQDSVTSALCSGSEIPKLGRAELSGHHHWWKNTIFLLVLAVHGMIIWSYILWGCRWRSFGSTYCSGWGVRAAPGTLVRALWPLVMVIWKFCSGPGARAVPGIVRHAIMPHLEVIWQFWSTCCDSAAGGHLKVLQWVRGQGCPWDSITCCNAAAGGHLEVLQWSSS